ncbi:MAG: transcriptional regulator [Bacteroidales bacterium]|nr:transcriptional regulator [Bacteroidales bacterium]
MKEVLKDLDKAFENRTRLGIMSALVVNESLDFNALKDLLGVTDGNLASHLKSLEKSKYINFKKDFLGRKPNTTYFTTTKGIDAFKKHLKAIERLLKLKFISIIKQSQNA